MRLRARQFLKQVFVRYRSERMGVLWSQPEVEERHQQQLAAAEQRHQQQLAAAEQRHQQQLTAAEQRAAAAEQRAAAAEQRAAAAEQRVAELTEQVNNLQTQLQQIRYAAYMKERHALMNSSIGCRASAVCLKRI